MSHKQFRNFGLRDERWSQRNRSLCVRHLIALGDLQTPTINSKRAPTYKVIERVRTKCRECTFSTVFRLIWWIVAPKIVGRTRVELVSSAGAFESGALPTWNHTTRCAMLLAFRCCCSAQKPSWRKATLTLTFTPTDGLQGENKTVNTFKVNWVCRFRTLVTLLAFFLGFAFLSFCSSVDPSAEFVLHRLNKRVYVAVWIRNECFDSAHANDHLGRHN